VSERTLSYVDGQGGEEQTFPAPYLVIALECERPLARPARLSLAEVERVVIGRAAERSWSRASEEGRAVLSVGLGDGWMSGRHASLRRGDQGWLVRDEGSKNGTFVNGRAATETTLVDGDVIEAGSTVLLYRDRVRRSARDPADQLAGAGGHPALTTLHPEAARELAAVPHLAAAGVPLILGGESGTGKELTARAVHELGGRPGPFIAINCGALPDTLVEAELFGARRGAYSGASEDRPGLVRAAHGGTLFLDEVAELPAGSQVKLLRVLQEGEVTPLGGTLPIAVDVRIVAASHRPLPELVAAGQFRADLYARLAGAHLTLRPLRERREDLGMLVALLLERIAGQAAHAVRLEREAARALFLYSWPLNVRELEQALRAALALAGGARIGLGHLPGALRGGGGARDGELALRDELVHLLSRHGGNVSAVARDKGVARVQVRRWCRRLGLDPETFRS
jgi:transcriptional regulator with PAS, ATPase and Fis domain